MSDALVKQPDRAHLVAHGSEWEALKEQAQMLVESGFLPKHLDTGNKALAVMIAGRELGVPPMQAVRGIYVVDGKPSLSAELMLALAYQNLPGFKFEVVVSTTELCKVRATRPGGEPAEIAFSIQDAARAGLTAGYNWKKYPAQMLRARATSAVLRVTAPDAIRGVYTPEELGYSEREQEVDALAASHKTELPPTGVSLTVESERADDKEVVDNG